MTVLTFLFLCVPDCINFTSSLLLGRWHARVQAERNEGNFDKITRQIMKNFYTTKLFLWGIQHSWRRKQWRSEQEFELQGDTALLLWVKVWISCPLLEISLSSQEFGRHDAIEKCHSHITFLHKLNVETYKIWHPDARWLELNEEHKEPHTGH